MVLKRDEKKEVPVEEWGAKEWETAYNILTAKYNKLRDLMRRAIQTLNAAI